MSATRQVGRTDDGIVRNESDERHDTFSSSPCAVFGVLIGNLIILPALVIQREFEAASFGMLVGLSTAIGQFTCVFGPGLLGLVRDLTGGYTASLALCIALEVVAAAVILVRPGAIGNSRISDSYRPE